MAGFQISRTLQCCLGIGRRKTGYHQPWFPFSYSRVHFFGGYSGSLNAKGVTVRPARTEDYEAVLDIIPDLYTGADYLPAMYHSFLANPSAYPYLAEVEGKVVAFANCIVVGNGTTVVSTGGRCRSEVKGQGLTNEAEKVSRAAARQCYPRLETLARVAVDSSYYQKIREGQLKGGKQIVLERSFLQYVTTSKSLMDLLSYLKRLPELNSGSLESLNDKKRLKPETIQKSFSEGHFIWGSNRLPAEASNDSIMGTMPMCKLWGSLEMCTRFNDVYNTISTGAFITSRGCHILDVSINGRCTFLRGLGHICNQINDRSGLLQKNNPTVLYLSFPSGSAEVKVELKKVLGTFLGDPTKSVEFPSERILIINRPLLDTE